MAMRARKQQGNRGLEDNDKGMQDVKIREGQLECQTNIVKHLTL